MKKCDPERGIKIKNLRITIVKLCPKAGYIETRKRMKKKRYFFNGEGSGGDLADANEQELAKTSFSSPDGNAEPIKNSPAADSLPLSSQTVVPPHGDDICSTEAPCDNSTEEPAAPSLPHETPHISDPATDSQASDTTPSPSRPLHSHHEAQEELDGLPADPDCRLSCSESLPKEAQAPIAPRRQEERSRSSGKAAEEAASEEVVGAATRNSKGRSGRGYPYILLIALCFLTALSLVGAAIFSASPWRETDNAPTSDSTPADPTSPQDSPSSTDDTQAPPSYLSRARSSVGIRASLDDRQVCLSGVGLFSDGYIATVYDPLLEDGQTEVTLWNGKVYPAAYVGSLPSAGLSLLRISSDSELEYLSLSDISLEKADTGDALYAIGSAESGELPCSLYACHVSHSDRSLDSTDTEGRRHTLSVIQLSGLADSSLLGCPLFDSNGNGVALALSQSSRSDAYFAVSLHSVAELLSFIRDGETPSKEALSLLLRTPAILGIEGKQACVDGIWGIEITGFPQNGDAEEKLRRGDLIVRIDGTAVASTATLKQLLEGYSSGDSAEIFVYRNGQKLSFVVRLG